MSTVVELPVLPSVEWLLNNPGSPIVATVELKLAARKAAGDAGRDGKLVRPETCSCCPWIGGRIAGHHEDYSEDAWLKVIWLCSECHSHRHHQLRVAAGVQPGPMKSRRLDGNSVISRIRILRKRAGEAQWVIASMLGISPHIVSKWERGIALPNPEQLERLAAHFDVDISHFDLDSEAA